MRTNYNSTRRPPSPAIPISELDLLPDPPALPHKLSFQLITSPFSSKPRTSIPRLLIANLELEFLVTRCKQRSGPVSNRKFFAVFHLPPRPVGPEVSSHSSPITCHRIPNRYTAIKIPNNPYPFNHFQFSNRDKIALFRVDSPWRTRFRVPEVSAGCGFYIQTWDQRPSHTRHRPRHRFARLFSPVLCFVRFEWKSMGQDRGRKSE